jgi:single-strand DNA-binding protein
MVNKVTLIGNLGKDPETKRLENGATVCKFSLATSESYRDKAGEWQTQTEWHNIVLWRDMAEKAETLQKGQTIYLEGKITTRSWEKDGVKQYATEIVGNYFRKIADKREKIAVDGQTYTTAPAQDDWLLGVENNVPEWWADYKKDNPDDPDEYDPLKHCCARFWKDFCNCNR